MGGSTPALTLQIRPQILQNLRRVHRAGRVSKYATAERRRRRRTRLTHGTAATRDGTIYTAETRRSLRISDRCNSSRVANTDKERCEHSSLLAKVSLVIKMKTLVKDGTSIALESIHKTSLQQADVTSGVLLQQSFAKCQQQPTSNSREAGHGLVQAREESKWRCF